MVESSERTHEDRREPGAMRVESHAVFDTRALQAHLHAASQAKAVRSPPAGESVSARKGATRSHSVQTTRSSLGTEGTDYPWSTSTAPTSAVETPARNSGPTAPQIQLSGPDDWNPQDAHAMRHELEKHKRLQEAKAQQELEDQVLASLDQNAPPLPRLDSNQSADITRRKSQRQRSAPRSESRQETEMLRSASKRSQQSTQPNAEPPTWTYMDATPHMFGNYFVPSSIQTPMGGSAAVSEAPSRSRSLVRNLTSYMRPGTGTRTPNASVVNSRPESRDCMARQASTRSWRNWRPFSRSQSNDDNVADSTRPMSSRSRSRHRRSFSRNISEDLQADSKRPIDLNRELPPLPSLDQWDAVEPEKLEAKPKHIATMAEPQKKYSLHPHLPENRELLPSTESDLESPTHDLPFVESAPPVLPAVQRFRLSMNFGNTVSQTPTSPIPLPPPPPPPVPIEQTIQERRRSRAIQAMATPDLSQHILTTAHVATPYKTPGIVALASPPATSLKPYQPILQPSQATPQIRPRPTHTRAPTDPTLNFSRKISSEDYHSHPQPRATPARKSVDVLSSPVWKNFSRGGKSTAAVTTTAPPGASRPGTGTDMGKDEDTDKVKAKKKWWSLGRSKSKRVLAREEVASRG